MQSRSTRSNGFPEKVDSAYDLFDKDKAVAPFNDSNTRAIGAVAIGALALGAFAIGAVAIGLLRIGRMQIKHLEVDELIVKRVNRPK